MRSAAAILVLLIAAPVAAQQEVVEPWPDGTVHERFTLDAEGRRDGGYESFRTDGSIEQRGAYAKGQRAGVWTTFAVDGTKSIVANYRRDQLDGKRETFDAAGVLVERTNWRAGLLDGPFEHHAGDEERSGRYRAGRLHGPLKITAGRRIVSRQTWVDGELLRLDDLDRPFPVGEEELRRVLSSILTPSASDDHADDPKAAGRHAALRRLQAYRALCRLSFAGMTLVDEWNDLCDAAAEVCARNGALSHDPPRPPGMDDDRYRQGHLGASRSNLAGGGGMERSVDSYMDDSDPTNIDRIGHRRWCLNPALLKTAFGESQGYSAMWSMDGSGSAPKGLEAVLYPPAGFVPIDFFGPRHAWSITMLRGGVPAKADLVARIRVLDDRFVPTGEPLELDWLDIAAGGFGAGTCIVFRPVGLEVRVGARYLAELSTDRGKTFAWRYVVAFSAPIESAR